jgi:hypothetical protein
MAKKTIHVLTCDGPDCDLRHEREEGAPVWDGIREISVSMNGDVLWTGCLCAACEKKAWGLLKSTLSLKKTIEAQASSEADRSTSH